MYKGLSDYKRKATLQTNKAAEIVNNARALLQEDQSTVRLESVVKTIETALTKRDQLLAFENEMETLLVEDPTMAATEESKRDYRREMSEHITKIQSVAVAAQLEELVNSLKLLADAINDGAFRREEAPRVDEDVVFVPNGDGQQQGYQSDEENGQQRRQALLPLNQDDVEAAIAQPAEPRRSNRRRSQSAAHVAENIVFHERIGAIEDQQQFINRKLEQFGQSLRNIDANVKGSTDAGFAQLRELLLSSRRGAESTEGPQTGRNPQSQVTASIPGSHSNYPPAPWERNANGFQSGPYNLNGTGYGVHPNGLALGPAPMQNVNGQQRQTQIPYGIPGAFNQVVNHTGSNAFNPYQPPVDHSSPQVFGATKEDIMMNISWEQAKETAKIAAQGTMMPFSGEEHDWQTFIGQFDNNVHTNKLIDYPAKQSILIKLLPKHLAAENQTNGASYETYMMIRANLDRQFNRRRTQMELACNQLDQIVFPPAWNDMIGALNKYATLTYKSTAYGINPNDPYFMRALFHKLPIKIKNAVHRKFEYGPPSFHELVNAAQDAISYQQSLALHGCVSDHHRQEVYATDVNYTDVRSHRRPQRQPARTKPTKAGRTAPCKQRPCAYCSDEAHNACSCHLTVNEKIERVKSKGLCHNCLSAEHRVADCKSRYNCFKCGKLHFTGHCTKIVDALEVNNLNEMYNSEEEEEEDHQSFRGPGARTPENH